jgi:predicted nucleic acid-binding protein
MKYVLDASVAVSWVLPETLSAKAVRVRNDYRKGLHDLIAPDIFPGEVANALTRAERKKIIKPPQGTKRFIAAMRFAPDLHPYLPLLSRAFAISSAMRVAVYDCLYVILAEQEGCELLTADEKLVNNLQAKYPFIVSLASLP